MPEFPKSQVNSRLLTESHSATFWPFVRSIICLEKEMVFTVNVCKDLYVSDVHGPELQCLSIVL